jgi:hypothetical protein
VGGIEAEQIPPLRCVMTTKAWCGMTTKAWCGTTTRNMVRDDNKKHGAVMTTRTWCGDDNKNMVRDDNKNRVRDHNTNMVLG